MSKCCELAKLNCCSNCSLKTLGYIVGWLGVTYRTVLLVTLCVLISNLTEYDPSIYELFFSIILSYTCVSLLADLLLILGIRMNIPYLLIPYISMEGFEIFLGSVGIVGGSVLLGGIDKESYIGALIPVGIIVIGIYLTLWIYLIKLYNEMEGEKKKARKETAEGEGEGRRKTFLRYFKDNF